MVADPIRYSSTPIADYTLLPESGADTKQVLSELLGADAEEYCRLRDLNVVS
jgi:crotonobetainyl-CoA:carnitine CoA-transferase CaiB-like acyl-CoA transferase